MEVVHLILNDARNILCDNLSTSIIVRRLRSRNVLNDDDTVSINRIQGLGDKVIMLLTILKAKDVREQRPYEEFMDALHEFDRDLYREVKDIESRYLKPI